MFETVLIMLALLVAAFGVGRFTGRRAGVGEENLRVQGILHNAIQVVGHGGRIQAIWQRIERNISQEELLERLRESHEKREADRQRLLKLEGEYNSFLHALTELAGEDLQALKKQRRELWMLLDHIDTLDDACKDDNEAFRKLARKHQQRRHEIWDPESDDDVASFQQRVDDWVHEVLGVDSACNVQERALRCAEEVIELAQVCEVAPERLHKLVDYVFGRDVGEAAQEIAGSLVTLYAMANALGVNAEAALEAELARIQKPEVKERVRRRQNEKRAVLLAEHGAHCD